MTLIRTLLLPLEKGGWEGIEVYMNQQNHLKYIARRLRNDATEAERKLWQYLRRKQIQNLQFYRQKPLGKYIVDFYCPAKKLVVEADGGQHYESGELIREDITREAYLKNVLKLRVLRFTNTDITHNMSAVIDRIIEVL